MKYLVSFFLVLFIIGSTQAKPSKQYYIYEIDQDVPLYNEAPRPTKNYYTNMGMIHGLKIGNTLAVYRRILKINRFNGQKRNTIKLKIAEIEIIHVEREHSVAKLKELDKNITHFALKLDHIMKGDQVGINIKK